MLIRPKGILEIMIIGSSLWGCATPAPHPPAGQVEPVFLKEHLGFLEVGKTTREEVLLRFGVPTAQFERERILAYRLMRLSPEGEGTQDRLVVVAPERDPDDPRVRAWRRAEYSLVLVFGEKHVLEKHSLVKVR